jgi:hypothetical protein
MDTKLEHLVEEWLRLDQVHASARYALNSLSECYPHTLE